MRNEWEYDEEDFLAGSLLAAVKELGEAVLMWQTALTASKN